MGKPGSCFAATTLSLKALSWKFRQVVEPMADATFSSRSSSKVFWQRARSLGLFPVKHYAESGRSVGTNDETNITDRLKQHKAEGFIGFYSTIASSALVNRLKELHDQGTIEAFDIYDGARIETGFHDVGLSGVLLQHLPESHTSLRRGIM